MARIQPLILFLVGINHGNLKNRLGAYHAPLVTFLDFNMLRTLPEGQVRNGFAGKRRIYHSTECPIDCSPSSLSRADEDIFLRR